MLVEDGHFSFRGLPQRGAACTTWFFAVGTVQAVVVLPFRNGPATPRTWRWGGVEFSMGVLKIIEIFHLERCRYNKFTSEFQHLQGAETLGKCGFSWRYVHKRIGEHHQPWSWHVKPSPLCFTKDKMACHGIVETVDAEELETLGHICGLGLDE